MQSQTQASDFFSQTGRFPKQQHVFLVRFVMNNNSGDADLTFAVKSADKPTVNITTQELSQYNKKRVVYTGYKNADLSIVFYDSADQAAQSLWATYSQYYFGDFAQSYTAFSDDIENSSSNWISNLGSAGFGYTAANGGQTSFGTQFLIKYIEILQFNGGTYDTYTLINPKISVCKFDGLDYSADEISTVEMTFQYEAVIISPGSGGASSAQIEEFQPGQPFYGNPLNIPASNPDTPTEFYVPNSISNDTITSNILGSLFGNTAPNATLLSSQNYYNTQNGGGLGIFGNFVFGAETQATTSIARSIGSAFAFGNPKLKAALGLSGSAIPSTISVQITTPSTTTNAQALAAQSVNNPALVAALGLSNPSSSIYPSNPLTPQAGIASDLYNNVSSISNSTSSDSTASNIVSAALLTDAVIGNSNGGSKTSSGLALSSTAIGAINAQRSGTSQYGYNPQITPFGQNYGYQGPNGYSYSAPTPYLPAQPFGSYVQEAQAQETAIKNQNVPLPTPIYTTQTQNNIGTVNVDDLVQSSVNANNDQSLSGTTYIDPITGISYDS
jgi:hypothetical protein